MLKDYDKQISQIITYSSDSIADLSKGCDQVVYKVKSREYESVVIKIPKEEKDKVEKQVLMNRKAVDFGLNATLIIHHTQDFLIETFLNGQQLSKEIHGNNKDVWINLGKQMKLLHSIPGASGFSNRVEGESCEKFPIFRTFEEKMNNQIVWEDSHAIDRMDEYLSGMMTRMHSIRKVIQPTFLHYDIQFDNIIVATDNQNITLIDFADAGMGDPLEDFAFLRSFLYSTEQWDWVVEGYGGVSDEELAWIDFFSIVWLTWALCGEDKPEKRQEQLQVAESIVQLGLVYLAK
jgi:thiamine kinase-like enzyme